MNTQGTLGYIIAVGEIAFGLIGFVTGWMNPAESMTVLGLGLSTLGIHQHNVAVGRIVQNRGI